MDVDRKFIYVKPFKKAIFTSKSHSNSFTTNLSASKTTVSYKMYFSIWKIEFILEKFFASSIA